MSLSRSTLNVLRRPLARTVPLSARATPSTATLLQHQQTRAGSDYGSGKGDPKGGNPQDQGANPSADIEHPGPPPPKAGEGSGGGPTKGTSSGHTATNQNSDVSTQGQNKDVKPSVGNNPTQKRGYSTTSTFSAMVMKRGGGRRTYATTQSGESHEELRSEGTKGAKPKIVAESPPAEGQESDEVKKHNEGFESRAEKPHEKVSEGEQKQDAVGKGFWSGQGGADRDP